MTCNRDAAKSRLERILAPVLSVLLMAAPAAAQETRRAPRQEGPDIGLVRINFIAESKAAGHTFELNGRRIPDYRPTIVQVFPSTGVVLDEKGHVLTFLGYRWVDIHASRPVIEILTPEGHKFPAKLLGIDQSVGVAVVLGEGAKLRKTPLCERCEVRDGGTVVAPVLEEPGFARFRDARVVSVDTGGDPTRRDGWVISFNRRLHGLGEPLLNLDRQVLGFIADQKPSPADPGGVQTVVYPITQLLASARKILQAGGDVRTGWLGVYIEDFGQSGMKGIAIRRVQDESPARKAGLRAEDILVRFNGRQVEDSRQFIQMVQDTPIGTKVAVEVLRQGKPLVLTSTVEIRPPEPGPEQVVIGFPGSISLRPARPVPEAARFGIETVSMTPQLAGFLRVPAQSGLLVSSVEADRIFGRAGLKAGDILLQVDGVSFSDSTEFMNHIQSRGREGRLDLQVFRNGVQHSIRVNLSPENPSRTRQPKP